MFRGIYYSLLLLASPWVGQAFASLNVNPSVDKVDKFTTTDGTTYSYHFSPAQGSNTTFLFMHGYPSSYKDWESQIAAMSAAGYGTIAPDMLGFGASDMPTEPEAYDTKRLSDHLIELLDHENLGTVIAVGHDWGVVVLSRLAGFYPERLEKIVFVNVGHLAPGGFLDLDAINAQGLRDYGYMPYGYWYFFNRYDASSVIDAHLDSYWHLIFPENHTLWIENFSTIGGARAWLNANTITDDPPFLGEAYRNDWKEWMTRPNATRAGLNCYRSQLQGVQEASDATLTEEDWKLRVPVLAIAGAYDWVARADVMIEQTRPWAVAGFESAILEGGHWLSLEKADEMNELLLEFASK